MKILSVIVAVLCGVKGVFGSSDPISIPGDRGTIFDRYLEEHAKASDQFPENYFIHRLHNELNQYKINRFIVPFDARSACFKKRKDQKIAEIPGIVPALRLIFKTPQITSFFRVDSVCMLMGYGACSQEMAQKMYHMIAIDESENIEVRLDAINELVLLSQDHLAFDAVICILNSRNEIVTADNKGYAMHLLLSLNDVFLGRIAMQTEYGSITLSVIEGLRKDKKLDDGRACVLSLKVANDAELDVLSRRKGVELSRQILGDAKSVFPTSVFREVALSKLSTVEERIAGMSPSKPFRDITNTPPTSPIGKKARVSATEKSDS